MTEFTVSKDDSIKLELARKVEVLRGLRDLLTRWFKGEYMPEGKIPLRAMINSKIVESRAMTKEVGAHKFLTVAPPAAIGGVVARNIDPFDNVFENFWGISVIPSVIDSLDQAIGVFQSPEYARKLEDQARATASQMHLRSTPGQATTRVFVVHGHDESVLIEVERLLRGIALEPVILRQQPSQGRTIIEKFETYAAGVGFAIILLTADDEGRSRARPPTRIPGSWKFRPKKLALWKPRARQNVILELGFFIGKLGRDRVCALYHAGVEIPSDYKGVLFVSLAGRWKQELVRELGAAGIPFDREKALAEV